MSTNVIPIMTDPLSVHWRQPHDIRQMPMDDTHVLLSSAQVKQLAEYSTSYPTGTYDGKCWKAQKGKSWYLCWYGPHADPKKIGIEYRIILEVTPDIE